jgi:hypothetical protein
MNVDQWFFLAWRVVNIVFRGGPEFNSFLEVKVTTVQFPIFREKQVKLNLSKLKKAGPSTAQCVRKG